MVSNNVAINYDGTTGAILNYKDLQFAKNTHVVQVQDFVSKYYGIDEANLMSKTFAKLREVTVGYEVPARILSGTFISKLTVSLVGRNLIYFYKDKRFKDVDLISIISPPAEQARSRPLPAGSIQHQRYF